MKITKETIMKFVSSSDKENSYVAAVALRKDAILRGVDNSKLLKLIPVDERVHTLEDIYEELGIEDPAIYKDPVTSLEKFINACLIIPKIVEVYNEGEILDWDNQSQYKYLPYLEKKKGSGWLFRGADGGAASGGPCAFHYKSRGVAEQGAKKFLQVYIDYINYKG